MQRPVPFDDGYGGGDGWAVQQQQQRRRAAVGWAAFVDQQAAGASWYQPHLTEREANNLLGDLPDGVFVIRRSRYPGGHILSYVCQRLIHHWLLLPNARGDSLGLKQSPRAFANLSQFAHFYIYLSRRSDHELDCPLNPSLAACVEARRRARHQAVLQRSDARGVRGSRRTAGRVQDYDAAFTTNVVRNDRAVATRAFAPPPPTPARKRLIVNRYHHHHPFRRTLEDVALEERVFSAIERVTSQPPPPPQQQQYRVPYARGPAPPVVTVHSPSRDGREEQGAASVDDVVSVDHYATSAAYNQERTTIERTYIYTDVSESISESDGSGELSRDGEERPIDTPPLRDWYVVEEADVREAAAAAAAAAAGDRGTPGASEPQVDEDGAHAF